ncbi:MAG TPA: carbon-nitrogen hydrolase [Candidatus Hydrogenedentes bacterium]|nr:carbon-nitrogen hydrolase [Candidatus Hydrogenedentota bacterium]HNT86802.1 carbon-nitrogen hydrolase [Candidatus Hydrogenedentota bacterium]
MAETTHPSRVTIGLVQMTMGPDCAANLRAAQDATRRAAAAGARIICLPELYRSQYFCQKEDARLFDLAEPVPGPSTEAFQALAAELRAVIIVPVFEKRAPGVHHNSAAVIDADGALLGLYRKMHVPDDPAYYEKFYFAPGDLGFRVFDTAFGRVGVLICWDQWYPEAARLTALRGATMLFYPTAIGWHPHEKAQYGAAQRDAWTTVQRGHAIANGVYVAAVNRVGFERPVPEQAGIEFWGMSFVADPQGVIIAQAPEDREDVLTAEVDLEHLETIRRNWPFLRDRRIDAYHGIERRFLEDA